ncbi:MAG: response regulator transcription factor [Methylococcaceae bacterium]|nr:response regulator transcription factor [Methylococcaceae bacterium]
MSAKKRPVVIVEDHPAERDELKYLLEKFHPDMEVVGEFGDIESAWAMIRTGQVEGVFLDINFGTGDKDSKGLELAEMIHALKPAPWIVFVSGRVEHALEGYKSFPIGFLAKPVKVFELEKVLSAVRERFPTNPSRISVRYQADLVGDDNGKLVRFLEPSEILFIHVHQGATTKVYMVDRNEILFKVNVTLKDWQFVHHLYNWKFGYISKQTIVNFNHANVLLPDLEEVTPSFRLGLRNSIHQLPVGPAFLPFVREALRSGVMSEPLKTGVVGQKEDITK